MDHRSRQELDIREEQDWEGGGEARSEDDPDRLTMRAVRRVRMESEQEMLGRRTEQESGG